MDDADKKMFRNLSEKVFVMGVTFFVVSVATFFFVITNLAANKAGSTAGVLCAVGFYFVVIFLYHAITLSYRIYKLTTGR